MSPEFEERLRGQGPDPVAGTPDEFAAFLREEIAKWRKVVQFAGVNDWQQAAALLDCSKNFPDVSPGSFAFHCGNSNRSPADFPDDECMWVCKNHLRDCNRTGRTCVPFCYRLYKKAGVYRRSSVAPCSPALPYRATLFNAEVCMEEESWKQPLLH